MNIAEDIAVINDFQMVDADADPVLVEQNAPVHGWVMITRFNVSTGLFELDLRPDWEAYIRDHIVTLECQRKYITPEREYKIFTRNWVRNGDTYMGFCKHSVEEPYGTVVDYGTQMNLEGTAFNHSHAATSGKGQGRWAHSVLNPMRNIVRSADGHYFQATGQSAYLHNATWGPCYGGGLKDSVTGLAAYGVAENHGFAHCGPESARQGHYGATANIAAVEIWIYVQ